MLENIAKEMSHEIENVRYKNVLVTDGHVTGDKYVLSVDINKANNKMKEFYPALRELKQKMIKKHGVKITTSEGNYDYVYYIGI